MKPGLPIGMVKDESSLDELRQAYYAHDGRKEYLACIIELRDSLRCLRRLRRSGYLSEKEYQRNRRIIVTEVPLPYLPDRIRRWVKLIESTVEASIGNLLRYEIPDVIVTSAGIIAVLIAYDVQ